MERFVLKAWRAPIALLFTVTLVSCSSARVYVGAVRAANDYSQGEYQDANRRLMRIRDAGVFVPWIDYNLGTVYYALGEPASALDIWQDTDAGATGELAFRLAFNLGVLDYERGAYDSAYRRFRRALEIDPTSIEAKINLEFTIEKLDAPASGGAESERDAAPGAEVERILQYIERIERLERNTWRSTESVDEIGETEDW